MHNPTDARALYIVLVLAEFARAQNAGTPRWGQAVALVESTLFVHGGRTDPYNSYSYTSAPVTNDTFSLSLSSSFNLSSPPWNYPGGCSNCSTQQGPLVAWHTLTPFNTSSLLLFGGDSGPNSPIAVPDSPDSAALLNVAATNAPLWSTQAQSWADEPIRRIYHTASSAGGKVFIVGGQKDDGSGIAFSDHYVFDPSGPSFSALPSTNAPPDITGHQAIVMSNGRLLVFGGYSPSQNALIPFTTVWSLDTTQSSLTWTTLSVSSTAVPAPRRGFAAALVDGGKIVIQGGADAVMQTSVDDGWILDTSQNPMVWSSVTALTQLGPRRDHFALGVGSLVIFGFGYAQNGGASAALQLFDVSSGTILTSYTPPSAIVSPTITTLPGSSPSNTASSPHASGVTTGTPVYGSAEIPYPSGSQGTGNGGGNGSDPSGTDGGGNGNGGNGNGTLPSGASSKHAMVIALSTVLGVLALLVGSAAAVWYIRRRRSSQSSFHQLLDESGEDGEGSPRLAAAVPVASVREKDLPLVPGLQTIRGRLSSFMPHGKAFSRYPERIDMLAEEDTRQFDADWQVIRRDGSSGNSSWTSSRRRPKLDKVYDSLASLRSAGGAVLDYATGAAIAGARSFKSKEASTGSRSTAWQPEKEAGPMDFYSDDLALLRDEAPSPSASRPRGGRQASFSSYRDPFEDYEVESVTDDLETVYRDEPDAPREIPSLSDPPPRPNLEIHARAHRASLDRTPLTPVSEQPSVATMTDPASSSDPSLNRDPASSSYTVSGPSSSQLSYEPPQSPRRPSSILDANPSESSQFMRRSNSWWTRFAKAPLLDLHLGDKSPKPLDFRDPNPPPRLGPIEEVSQSTSPDSPENKRRSSSGRHHQVYSSHQHGRSASSLQTARTANSEMLERMAQTMQIVQNSTMSSHASGPSVDSRDESPERSYSGSVRPLSVVARSQSQSQSIEPPADGLVQSPTNMTAEESSRNLASVASDLQSPKRSSSGRDRGSSIGSVVAERVQAYERRMSQIADSPIKSPPPIPNRSRGGSGFYGLAPKPSLFVANPDHKRGSDSS